MRICHLKNLALMFVLLIVLSGCATTQPDVIHMTSIENMQSADSLSVKMRYYPLNYNHMGVTAADKEYVGAAPFLTGTLIGIASPVAAGLTAAKVKRGGTAAGVATIVLTIWSGKKLVDVYPHPEPDHDMSDFTQNQREAFEYGFTNRITEKRAESYSAGVLVGILTDVIFVLWVLHQLSRMYY